MSKLILIRGHSGSGKTTLAKHLARVIPDAVHYEADEFFVNNGQFQFDRDSLDVAHNNCRDKVRMALYSGKVTIVSNTFIKHWEFEPYLNLADEIQVLRCVDDHDNIHGLSYEDILIQKRRLEPYPGERIIKNGQMI